MLERFWYWLADFWEREGLTLIVLLAGISLGIGLMSGGSIYD